MRLGDLTVHLRLIALRVECGAKRTRISRLEAIVAQDPYKTSILVAEVMIHARGPLILLNRRGRRRAELKRARNSCAQARKSLASSASDRSRRAHSGRIVVNGKQLPVKRDLSGVTDRSQVRERSGLELRARNQI